MTAHVNENCIGCGLCTGICPTAFLMTDEGVAAARDEILPEWEGQVQEAAESAPPPAFSQTNSPPGGGAGGPPPSVFYPSACICSNILPMGPAMARSARLSYGVGLLLMRTSRSPR